MALAEILGRIGTAERVGMGEPVVAPGGIAASPRARAAGKVHLERWPETREPEKMPAESVALAPVQSPEAALPAQAEPEQAKKPRERPGLPAREDSGFCRFPAAIDPANNLPS